MKYKRKIYTAINRDTFQNNFDYYLFNWLQPPS